VVVNGRTAGHSPPPMTSPLDSALLSSQLVNPNYDDLNGDVRV
jgi:hypothetical protein